MFNLLLSLEVSNQHSDWLILVHHHNYLIEFFFVFGIDTAIIVNALVGLTTFYNLQCTIAVD